jgi:two-component system chemotaxis response regulator CheY
MRAVVVDDSRATRKLLSRMLSELGFDVQGADGGEEALEALRKEGPPDLMTIDWNMPGMTGNELVVAIRSEPDWEGIPLMMVTAISDQKHIREALSSGANEYVMKPFEKEDILEKIRILGLDSGAD